MNAPGAQFIDLSIRERSTRPRVPETAVESTERVLTTAAEIYDATARALGLHALPRPVRVAIDLESERWSSFLDVLKARVSEGSVTMAQRSTLLSIWECALRRQPSLRRPAVGVSLDGLLQASWSFADAPGRIFTLEIQRDGEVDWYYRDSATGISRGSDDVLTAELPADAYELLAAGFGSRPVGTR